jgi:hypothetical protein
VLPPQLRSQPHGSIKDVEGKPLKNELARAVFGKREAVWSFPNSGYGVVDGLCECDSAQWAAFVIPVARGAKFGESVRVKLNSYSDSPNNSARTVSHGINSTVPASISAKRRSISSDHAASTSGSDSVLLHGSLTSNGHRLLRSIFSVRNAFSGSSGQVRTNAFPRFLRCVIDPFVSQVHTSRRAIIGFTFVARRAGR